MTKVNAIDATRMFFRRGAITLVIAAVLLLALHYLSETRIPIPPNDQNRDNILTEYGRRVVFEVEDYMHSHTGRVPTSIGDLFNYSRARYQKDETFVENPLLSYPPNPFGPTQSVDILAPDYPYSPTLSAYHLDFGKGELSPPSQLNHFGAISYRALGTDRQHYLLCVTSRLRDRAVCIFSASE